MASVVYGTSGLPTSAHPMGSIFNNPVDGRTYVSDGHGWVPLHMTTYSPFTRWSLDSDTTVKETEVRILKATHDRFISWKEARDFAGSDLYLDFKRNKISLLLEIITHGFNPANALNQKVDEIKKFCNDYTVGLWSIETTDSNFESDWHINQFKVNIDMHFEKTEDRLLFMKDYIVLDKLSN